MTNYVVRRVLAGIPLIIVVPLLIFLLVDMVPGDPAAILAGENATPERIEEVRVALGLDNPVFVRYFLWLKAALMGDLGVSSVASQSVAELIGRRIGTTVSLVAVTAVLAAVIGFSLAVIATLRRGGVVDRAINAATSIAIALPPFWVGLILVAVFAVQIPLLPTSGFVPFAEDPWQWIVHLTLPAIALSLLPAAEITLHLRSSLGQELSTDYVANARAKGLTEPKIIFKHALKNAAIPVVTVFGYRISEVLAGTVTIEIIYNMPGLGRLAVDSVQSRDVPVLLAFVLFSTAVVVVINLIVDLSYGYFNPKVRA
ncbi:ABC transporter permease [Microbacterium sp. NC79]|uniref:ABC transporter permease n=1 Tax=Microbacterium sp. NC79 TaxID=2851009 RepID=UPI001C2C2E37|nr:ABC transporter permease [Microbacterium sp. NC79]